MALNERFGKSSDLEEMIDTLHRSGMWAMLDVGRWWEPLHAQLPATEVRAVASYRVVLFVHYDKFMFKLKRQVKSMV
jgi:hypothetical protein